LFSATLDVVLVPLIHVVFTDLRKFPKCKHQFRSQEIAPSRQGHFLFFAWHTWTLRRKDDSRRKSNRALLERIRRRTIVKNLAQNDPSRFAPIEIAFCNESQTDFAANNDRAPASPQIWYEPLERLSFVTAHGLRPPFRSVRSGLAAVFIGQRQIVPRRSYRVSGAILSYTQRIYYLLNKYQN
jgi:hypothetical protein